MRAQALVGGQLATALPASAGEVLGVQGEVAAEPAVAVAEAVAAQLPVDGRRVPAEPRGDLADRPAGLDEAEEGASFIEVEVAVGPGQKAPPRCKPLQRLGIRLSSQLAHKGGPTMAHYVAAKAGIMGFTRSLAYEVARDGITVNCLNPGPIDTPLLRALPPEWLDTKIKELPIGRFGRPEEVAPAALLLASEEGSYFVGASLNMNGGDVMV